jgi:hypothetical protein
MKHFLFEREEYRINPRFRNPRKRPLTMGPHALRHLKRGGGGGRQAADTRQKCVVKMNYSKSMAAHLEQLNRYLIREGAGKDGERAELYGTAEEEYRAHMAQKNIRIFLSPASNGVPLETLAKTFIKKLELETGYRLYWVGANHYNTAHSHAHLLINGTDKNGKDVYFAPDLVKTLMRENARDICTSLIGGRKRADMEREKKEELTANRYTYLDGRIKEIVNGRRVELGGVKKEKERYMARLDHLRKLGICAWKGGTYELKEGWEETLRSAGRYNTYLEARGEMRYTAGSEVRLYESGMGKKTGIVTKIYKIDEYSDNHAVLVEGIDGKGYFIPLYKKPEIAEGDRIEVVPKKNERGRLTPEFKRVDERTVYARIREGGYGEGYAGEVRREKERGGRDAAWKG